MDNTIASGPAPLQLTINPKPKETSENTSAAPSGFWSGEAPSFSDFLDVINPLQHIPGVSNIYQALTGDTQSTGAKIAGGALFGGPLGLLASVFDSIIESGTGTGVMGNVIAAVKGDDVPALQNGLEETELASNMIPDHLGPKQRAAYNAYVNASYLA